MSTEVKIRRGTAAQNATFTGVEGEVTYSTDEKRLITHDGATVGGTLQAKLSEVELVANKSNNTALGASATLYPTQNAVKSYADTGLALKVNKAGDTMTGALVLPAGTAAAPSLTFVGDLDTGIFSSGANEVGLVSTGIPIFSIKGDLFSYFNRQSADNLAAGFTVDKRGAIGDANGAVVSGAVISLNQARGWDGAAYGVVGDLRFVAAETLTGVAHGGQLLVRLTPVGSTTVVTVGTWASTGLTLAGTLDMGTHLINNVVNPVSAQDAATKSYVDTAVTGATPPFTDTTALVKGSADATKLMRFEVDGFTTATTRVLTPPNADIIIAGANFANAWSDGITQTFNPNGTSSGVNVGAHTVDPSALNNGDIWYQSTANELRARINGATVALGGGNLAELGSGGGGDPYTLTNTPAQVVCDGAPIEIALPTAGRYLITIDVQFQADALSAGDQHYATIYDAADATIVGSPINISLGASFFGHGSVTFYLVAPTARTMQLWAANFTAARGTVLSYSSIVYLRLG